MGITGRWLARGASGAVMCALAVSVAGAPPGAAAAGPPRVSPVPAAGTPALAPVWHDRAGPAAGAVRRDHVRGGQLHPDQPGRRDLPAGQRLQLQRDRAVPDHLLGAERERHGELDRAGVRLLPRLHRRELHEGGRGQRRRHRQHQHLARRPGAGLGTPRQRRRGHGPADAERAPARGRQVHRDQRVEAALLREPEPVHRQGRRLPEPARLRPLLVPRGGPEPDRRLQPATVPRRGTRAGRGHLHPGGRGCPAADLHAQPGQPRQRQRLVLTRSSAGSARPTTPSTSRRPPGPRTVRRCTWPPPASTRRAGTTPSR